MSFVGSSGKQYLIVKNSNTHAGGEGTVYEVAGEPNLVVKLYHRPNAEREQKILRMMGARPARVNDFAWPIDAIYSAGDGAFHGFVMPKVQGEPLRDIIVYDKRAGIPWSFYAIVSANIATAVQSLHDAGHVVGDLNPNNVLVDMRTGFVKLIDTDSFHIIDRMTGAVYRCTVGQPECLAPELQRIGHYDAWESFATVPLERSFNMETDRFSLAIMIFRTLMNGAHPFNSVIKGVSQSSFTCEDRIEQGLCAFFPETADPNGQLPPYAPSIDALPSILQNLFRRVFIYRDGALVGNMHVANAATMKNFFQSDFGLRGGSGASMQQRPTAEEWRSALIASCGPGSSGLVQCGRIAFHQYSAERKSCPWCEADARVHGANGSSRQQPMFTPPMPMSAPAPSSNASSGSYSPLLELPYDLTDIDQMDAFNKAYAKAHPRSGASRILSVLFKILVPIAAVVGFCILFNLDVFGWFDDVYQTTALSTSRAAATREAPTVDEIPVASSTEGPIFPAYAKDTRDSVYADYGYINTRGEWVLKPLFDKEGISLFSDGLARRYDSLSKLYGYMDASGQYVIRPAFRSAASAFSEGVAWVSAEGGYTFVNTTGEQILNETWRTVTDFSEGKAWVRGSARSVYYDEYDYDGPVLIDMAGNVVGYLNSNGNSFDATVEPFNSGRALVRKGGYGYADETGTVVIDLVYKEAESFSEGLAAVYDSNKRVWGYIDTEGDVVITPRFQKAGPFSEGLAAVQNEDGYYGYIDTTGRYVIEPRFAEADDFSGGYAAAKDNETGLYALINTSGSWAFPPRFTSISS